MTLSFVTTMPSGRISKGAVTTIRCTDMPLFRISTPSSSHPEACPFSPRPSRRRNSQGAPPSHVSGFSFTGLLPVRTNKRPASDASRRTISDSGYGSR